MSTPHTSINQNAYVVADLEAAITFWEDVMRVGPFFRFPQIVFEKSDYRGEDRPIHFDAAIAWSGGVLIELIVPLGPSIFQEWADAGHHGVQHLAVFTEDFDIAAADVLRRGGRRVQGGSFADGSTLAYFDMGGDQSIVLEVAALSPAVLGLFEAVRQASLNWDGQKRLCNDLFA